MRATARGSAVLTLLPLPEQFLDRARQSRLEVDQLRPARRHDDPDHAVAVAAMRAGLIDEYTIVTHPVLVGGGTPFFTVLDSWVNLNLVETRTFPGGVVLTRYETRR